MQKSNGSSLQSLAHTRCYKPGCWTVTQETFFIFSLSLTPTGCPAGYSRAVMALVGLTCVGVLH